MAIKFNYSYALDFIRENPKGVDMQMIFKIKKAL